MSLSATIKTIQDIMRKDAGVDGDAQRIGQLADALFKFLNWETPSPIPMGILQ